MERRREGGKEKMTVIKKTTNGNISTSSFKQLVSSVYSLYE